MNLQELRDDLYRKLGIEHPGNAPLYIRSDVATAINASFQLMQLAGENYFVCSSLSLPISASVASYDLDDAVQRVEGSVRLQAGPPLRPLRTRSEYDAFAMIYGTGDTYDTASGTPIAYYLETIRQAAAADSVGLKLHLAPTPNDSDTLLLDVVEKPPAFTGESFCESPLPPLPVPHGYVESILLPLARNYIMRSHWYKGSEQLTARITEDYQMALRLMGLADPEANATRNTKPDGEEAGL